jgi:serine/threonine protein kinase
VKDPATNFALSDVWSIMLSWLELLTGLPPFFWMLDAQRDLHRLFREPDAQTRLEQMLDTYYTPLLPSDILAFFKWALKVDESVRPGLVDIGRHEYTCRNILSRE